MFNYFPLASILLWNHQWHNQINLRSDPNKLIFIQMCLYYETVVNSISLKLDQDTNGLVWR